MDAGNSHSLEWAAQPEGISITPIVGSIVTCRSLDGQFNTISSGFADEMPHRLSPK